MTGLESSSIYSQDYLGFIWIQFIFSMVIDSCVFSNVIDLSGVLWQVYLPMFYVSDKILNFKPSIVYFFLNKGYTKWQFLYLLGDTKIVVLPFIEWISMYFSSDFNLLWKTSKNCCTILSLVLFFPSMSSSRCVCSIFVAPSTRGNIWQIVCHISRVITSWCDILMCYKFNELLWNSKSVWYIKEC